MKKLRIVVLNDYHPQESSGAASVALKLAKGLLFDQADFCFVSTKSRSLNLNVIEEEIISSVIEKRYEPILLRIRNKIPLVDSLLRLFSPLYLPSLIRIILKGRINAIWIHQIGNRFPYIVILIARLLRIRVVLTVHDFTFLRFKKIYPQDIDFPYPNIESALLSLHLENNHSYELVLTEPPNWAQNFTKWLFYKIDSVVYISALANTIYVDNGFPVGRVIENVIDICSCRVSNLGNTDQSKFNILFAGRIIGKGLERLSKEILLHNDAHLHVAGREELYNYVSSLLPSDKFSYHGYLGESELTHLIHSMDLVSVISECFDVYPTIGLESIVHGTPVITSPSTGIFKYIFDLSPKLALVQNSFLDLNSIAELKHDHNFIVGMESLARYFSDKTSLCSYLDLFRK